MSKPLLSLPIRSLFLWLATSVLATNSAANSTDFRKPANHAAIDASGAPPPLALIADDLLTRIGSDNSLPATDNPRVQRQVEFFLSGPQALRATLRRARPYLFNIVTELEQASLPTGLALLPAIESAFDPKAVSPMHAAGLWQFIPATGDRYGLTLNRQYDGRFSPADSTMAAVRFLTALGEHYEGDWLLALAAYNTGPGNVDRAIARAKREALPVNYWDLSLPRETMDYVPRLLALLRIVAQPQRYNIELPFIANEPHLLAIDMQQRFSLSNIAEFTDLSIAELRRHNPALKADASPEQGPHTLQLPAALARSINDTRRREPDRVWHNVPAVHVVVSGDSLSELARTYETSVDRLQALNNLPDTRIGIGKKLTVGVSQAPDRPLDETSQISCHGVAKNLNYQYGTHTVRSGDSIWSIARTLGTQSGKLRSWNDMGGEKRVLSIGEQMHHASLKPKKERDNIIRYRARANDSLTAIAEKFGITTLDLRRCNSSLQTDPRVAPGQLVLIPVGPS